MREKIRRLLLFLITAGVGSLIIAVDASIDVIIAGTVLAGFLALIVTGAVKVADLRPSQLRNALREQRQKAKKAVEEKAEEKAAEEADSLSPKSSLIKRFASTDIDLSGMLGTLATSVKETVAHIRAPKSEKKRAIDEIDTILDQAVDDSHPDRSTGSTEASHKGAEDSVDPLAALAELDVDSLGDLDVDEGTQPEMAFESDQISLISEGGADTVSEILKAQHSESGDLGDMTAVDLSELSDMGALGVDTSILDNLDLDEVEIEVEEIDDEEIGVEEVSSEETSTGKTDTTKISAEEVNIGLSEQPEEDFDMVAFASGGVVDDDLIAELKSDVKKKKKYVENISLVRELRGEKYDGRELATELEEVLALLNPK